MGIFGVAKARKMEIERNSLYFFWSRGYKLLDNIWTWHDITEELPKIAVNYFFVDIQGSKAQSFIMGRDNVWDLLNSADDKALYRAEKNGEHVIFGALNGAYVSVMKTDSELAKQTEAERAEYQSRPVIKISDVENSKELKECLGYKPRHYFVNY